MLWLFLKSLLWTSVNCQMKVNQVVQSSVLTYLLAKLICTFTFQGFAYVPKTMLMKVRFVVRSIMLILYVFR